MSVREKSAFTLVEILIGASVMVIFLGSLFLMYSGGTRMFSSGSWKLRKQKENERFLNTLKERIEQASNLVTVSEAGELSESGASFFVKEGNYNFKTAGSVPTQCLLAFTICKPSLPGRAGLVLYHVLKMTPCETGTNLMNLELFSTTNISSGEISTNKPTGFDFLTSSLPTDHSFTASASAFNLNSDKTFRTTEIGSMSLSLVEGSDDLLLELTVEYEQSKHESTSVTSSIIVKIDSSVDMI